ncbi:MAG TPA: hypothetical protein VJ732_04090 [Bryobacteraceae bacterium]|nr:hypothetical protein [Bryobacteraceae bacterium]
MRTTETPIRTRLAVSVRALATPSPPELLFAVLVLTTFGRASSWPRLLFDGDTGWHIRCGEFILRSGSVPVRDLFSFSRPQASWLAWEWLSDVIFAWFHAWSGLTGVIILSAAVLCMSGALLFAWLLRRGAGLWIALAATLATVSGSSLHYLARPHIFSLLLLTVGLWILDEDRRQPNRRLWVLIPVSALWANLHAGFAAWLATLALLVLVTGCRTDRAALRRYGLLASLCAAATLANPYGWRLHQHIVGYLNSAWILENVQEFQSPQIRAENMWVFASFLLLGISLAGRALARRQYFEGLLAFAWGLAALRSARHVPLYMIAAAPVIASEAALWWAARSARQHAGSPVRVFWDIGQEWGRARRPGICGVVLGCAALWIGPGRARIADFPASRFPVAAITQNLARLAPSSASSRVLTSDQWADYLIYRFYPRQLVFFDGRSGPEVGREYQQLRAVRGRWAELLARYDFEVALLPLDWPLASLLERDPRWKVVYRDAQAVVLVVRPDGLKRRPGNAECQTVGG